MVYYNNAIQTRRELLTRIIRLLKEKQLVEKIDRIPLIMRPKSKHPIRCCVHKDRAVVKYKIMAILGFSTEEETDELMTLSEYATTALKRTTLNGQFLTVVDEACSSCVQVNYIVSNLCQGCEARACQFNCPQKAITFINGKAHIDNRLCINCGLCQKACPYHAIAYLPVPCEEACPVKAIKKNEDGIEVIDNEKCIECGKCLLACPFGAIIEKTQILEIFKALNSPEPVIAMVAPAFLGQFNAPPEKVLGSLKKLGFSHIIEVAEGAEITAHKEKEEWLTLKERNLTFMTSSCCPSFTSLINKHIPGLKPHVSHTPSPMIHAAQIANQKYPGARKVFISPCLAKRKEAMQSGLIDYVMTFEETGTFFAGLGIEVNESKSYQCTEEIPADARKFALSGGVASAIRNSLPANAGFKAELIDGLNKKTIGLLKAYSKKGTQSNFIEAMSCNGGCINGPCSISPSELVRKNLQDALNHIYHEDKIKVE